MDSREGCTVDSWYSGFLRQRQNVHYFKSSTISREPIKKAWWVSNQAENYHKFKSIYYIQVNWIKLIIHSLRAFSICSCWPALIFLDFFNAPGLESMVFQNSCCFSMIIEMAEQLIPYLSIVVFLQKPGLFESSMILNFCSFVFFEVLEEPSLTNIFSQKLQRIWLFRGVYFQTHIYKKKYSYL